ncbi:hypothetical protein CPC197_0965A, partial [Chlamydia psittaci C1/97]
MLICWFYGLSDPDNIGYSCCWSNCHSM